ncbi:hypothetical protein D3C76_1311860 [compost metagenome]
MPRWRWVLRAATDSGRFDPLGLEGQKSWHSSTTINDPSGSSIHFSGSNSATAPISGAKSLTFEKISRERVFGSSSLRSSARSSTQRSVFPAPGVPVMRVIIPLSLFGHCYHYLGRNRVAALRASAAV